MAFKYIQNRPTRLSTQQYHKVSLPKVKFLCILLTLVFIRTYTHLYVLRSNSHQILLFHLIMLMMLQHLCWLMDMLSLELHLHPFSNVLLRNMLMSHLAMDRHRRPMDSEIICKIHSILCYLLTAIISPLIVHHSGYKSLEIEFSTTLNIMNWLSCQ